MGVSQNVTEQVADKRELERQNQRLEEFADIVSHDLRNPLGVAETYIELAAAEDDSDHLRQASEAIERSQALIDDLLTLAKQGEAVAETEPVALATVAETSWQTVETRQATLDVAEGVTVEADGIRLTQLLENLYRNAIEHSDETVTVSVGPVDDGFYVADSGPGISEAERSDIFDAGYTTREEGTGFGLRIVEQIATAHGWAITVTESAAGGARFEFTGVESPD